MADNKDQEKDKKRSSRTTKVTYYRCSSCGGRKRETDTMNMKFSSQQAIGCCQECFVKQGRKSDPGATSGRKLVWTKKTQ